MIKCDNSMLLLRRSVCNGFYTWGSGTREGVYCLNLLFHRFGDFHLCFYGESSLKVMFELKAVFIICFSMLSILQLHIELGSPVSPEASYFLIPL